MPNKPTALTKLEEPKEVEKPAGDPQEAWKKSLFGRKSKLDTNTQISLVNSLRRGLSIKEACARAGVGVSTFFGWRNLHSEFSDIVEQAQTEAIAIHRANIDKHSKRDWRASAWTLERTHPNEYAPKSMVAVGGNIGITIKLDPTGYIEPDSKG